MLKPYPPTKPSEKLQKTIVIGSRDNCNYDCINIRDIPEGTEFLSVEAHSSYEGTTVNIEFCRVEYRENPHYEKELKRYEKKYETYQKALAEYEAKMKAADEREKQVRLAHEKKLYNRLKKKFEGGK